MDSVVEGMFGNKISLRISFNIAVTSEPCKYFTYPTYKLNKKTNPKSEHKQKDMSLTLYQTEENNI